MFASESYFSKGAIRVVVGSQQMKNEQVTNALALVDHWCSFIENFGDVLKEHGRSCNANSNEYKCLLKLSKYLFRTFTSIEVLLQEKINDKMKRQREENKIKHENCPVVEDEEKAIRRFSDTNKPSAVEITKSWITCFKDKGEQEIKSKYSVEDCPEATTLKEKKDWADHFLSKVLNCKGDKLNVESRYIAPTGPPSKQQGPITITQLTGKEPEKLDTGSCISKLKLLIRGVNRRMLSYANIDSINLGSPVEEI